MNNCTAAPANDTDQVLSSLKHESEWMTTDQVAIYLRTSAGHIRNLTSNGRIPFYKFGRSNRYLRSDLDNLILKNKRGGY